MGQIPAIGGAGHVVCPSCGETYLHQQRVEVFARSEDAADGLHADVDYSRPSWTQAGDDWGVHVDAKLKGNPSSRRSGLKIAFDCELCPAAPVLCIAQHKGQEQIFWED